MIPFLLFLLAVHPTNLEIDGFAGETISVSLRVVSDEEVIIEGTEIIEANKHISSGDSLTQVQMKIPPALQVGKYRTYLYIYPKSPSTLVGATAIPIQATVRNSQSQLVPGSSAVGERGITPWLLIAGVIGLIVMAAMSLKISKK